MPAGNHRKGNASMDNWTEMVEALIDRHVAPQGVQNAAVLAAMKKIPRHLFIPQQYREYAYEDRPIPIGAKQTISQPFIVAKMTDMLDLKEGDKVLEIGTGSGYQAAVLAQMGMRVTTVERIEQLAVTARKVFAELGLDIDSIVGDGREGYAQHAPYRGVIVTAGALQVEDSWLEQLEAGGRIVVPVVVRDGLERLLIRHKVARNRFDDKWYDYCHFVPLLPGIPASAEEPPAKQI